MTNFDPSRCAVGCSPQLSPPVGFANLRGKAGSVVDGYSGVYPLCRHHWCEIVAGGWGNVELLGWEDLPNVLERPGGSTDSPKGEPTPEESVWVSEGGNPSGGSSEEPDPEVI